MLTAIGVCWRDWQTEGMENSFRLFFIKSDLDYGHEEIREMLIKSAAWFYGVPKATLDNIKICRTSKGKPYFERIDIHFSISHSNNLWSCLVGPSNCGLDVQYIRPCNFKKIAGRFFSENENKYVEKKGIKGFFEIWAAREAYGKYTGQGFFGTMPELVSEEGRLKDVLAASEGRGEKIKLDRVFVEDNLLYVVCVQEKSLRPVVVMQEWKYEDYISFR